MNQQGIGALCSAFLETDRDWSKTLQALPKEDAEIVKTRLREVGQIADRGEDFSKRGGYPQDYTEKILTHSYALSKEGFRESAPVAIKEGDFGFCRSGTRSLAGGQPGEAYGNIIAKAAKSINHHAVKGDAPNQESINAALGVKDELIKLAKTDKNAAYYLEKIKEIEAAAATPGAKVSMVEAGLKVAIAKEERKYTSLTDHIHDYIKRTGGDTDFITNWQGAQAGNSWSENACKFKVIQLASRGLKYTPPPPDGVFMGSRNGAKTYKAAVKYYEENTKAFERDIETHANYQAAIQLLLENSNFSGNDKKARTVILARTEDKSVIKKYNIKPGEDAEYNRGSAESFSVFKTVVVHGSELTLTEVPYSRINGVYFLERTPGRNDCLFLGDRENEFNADTTGLKTRYVKSVVSGEDVSKYHDELKKGVEKKENKE